MKNENIKLYNIKYFPKQKYPKIKTIHMISNIKRNIKFKFNSKKVNF